jgi:hypothetical protein
MKTIALAFLALSLIAGDTSKPDPKDAEIAKLKAQVAAMRTALMTQIQASNAKDAEINDLRTASALLSGAASAAYYDKLSKPIIEANNAAKTAQTDYERKLADFCAVKPDGEDCPKK